MVGECYAYCNAPLPTGKHWPALVALTGLTAGQNRDDLEDEELQANQLTEKMPETMPGFKNHPLYVLERHLRRDEVVHPPAELGRFRGGAVYPRANVLALKTAENWMRQGRKVREGCQPMKWVKQNAVTVNRKRAVEMALAERDRLPVAGESGVASERDIMQGLYAESQTELYVPDPVVDVGIFTSSAQVEADMMVLRVKCRRTTSETSISTSPQCCLRVQHISHVRSMAQHAEPRAHLYSCR